MFLCHKLTKKIRLRRAKEVFYEQNKLNFRKCSETTSFAAKNALKNDFKPAEGDRFFFKSNLKNTAEF